MDLRRLLHLMALDEERHFARAAQRVFLSQPAFSRSIQALEQELGQRLFDRQAGEVRPTPAGQFLMARARQLLVDAKSLGRDMRLYGQAELGDTAFGMGPMPAATILPVVLPELRRRHPQVGLRVTEGHSAELFERLVAEDIEFFVADVRGMPQDVALDVQSLGRQHGGFFVRAGHPLAGQAPSAEEVWALGVATVHLPSPIKAALAGLLGLQPGQELRLALECDNVALLQAVALSTDIVLGVTGAAVRNEVLAGRLVPLKIIDMPSLYSEMGVVSLRNRSHSPMAQRVIDLIASVSLEINAEPASQPAGLNAPARPNRRPKDRRVNGPAV
jgi:DNA-binding transcriptional LysR family regulator